MNFLILELGNATLSELTCKRKADPNMRNRLIAVTSIVVLLIIGSFSLTKGHFGGSTETFSSATIKVGSSGQDVYELQGRLNYLGYYNGKIDGVFGSKTKGAVTWFQWKFGLKSDGVVGAGTKKKLVAATKDWKPGIAKVESAKAPPLMVEKEKGANYRSLIEWV